LLSLVLKPNYFIKTKKLTHPQAPYGFNYESKEEDNKKRRSWGALLGLQHFGGRGACWGFKMGIRRSISKSTTHTNLYIKQQVG